MSTKYYNKCIDNQPPLLLPYRMFLSSLRSTNFRSSFDRSLLALLSVNSASSVFRSKFHPSSAVPARAKQPNPFRISTSAISAHNSFRIRSSKTRHLKSFRIRTYEKTGVGPALSARLRELCASALSLLFSFLRPPVTGHSPRRLPACADTAIAGTIRLLNLTG